jgi:hypothetical protein
MERKLAGWEARLAEGGGGYRAYYEERGRRGLSARSASIKRAWETGFEPQRGWGARRGGRGAHGVDDGRAQTRDWGQAHTSL